MEQSNFERCKNVTKVSRHLNECSPPYTSTKAHTDLKACSKFKMPTPSIGNGGAFHAATPMTASNLKTSAAEQSLLSGAEKFHRAIAPWSPMEEWSNDDAINLNGGIAPTQLMDNSRSPPTPAEHFSSLKSNYLSCPDLHATSFLDQEVTSASIRGGSVDITSVNSELISKKGHYGIIKREKKHFEQRGLKTVQANSQNPKQQQSKSQSNSKEKFRGRKSNQFGNRYHCAPQHSPSANSIAESESSHHHLNNSRRRILGRESSNQPSFRIGSNNNCCNNIVNNNSNSNNAYIHDKGLLKAENNVNCNYCNAKVSPHKISKKKRNSPDTPVNNVMNIKQLLFRMCSDEDLVSPQACYNGRRGGRSTPSTQPMDLRCWNDETGDFLTPILLNSVHSYAPNTSQLLLNILAENLALNMSDVDIINFALRHERNRRMSYTKSFANIIASRAVAGDLKFRSHPKSVDVNSSSLSLRSGAHPMLHELCSWPRLDSKRFRSIYTNA